MLRSLIQCDFDGTITVEDEAFLLLDAYANGDWRKILAEYREGKISIGQFNSRAFAMVKIDKQTLVDFVRRTVQIRSGFAELMSLCRRNSFRFIIVSNGLDFYIKEVLRNIGSEEVELRAAQTWFNSGGIEVKYIGPDGRQINDGFKEAYTRSFLNQGYRVVYVGNGLSDMPSARLAHRVFAIGELLELCRDTNLNCAPFSDLKDVVAGLEKDA
jgi:2-hydroxy-3-keto-5-methylthiopentenyl-1-phosphate phosphatase